MGRIRRWLSRVAVIGWLVVSGALPVHSAAAAQQSFASAEDAGNALAAATRSHDSAALQAIFGPGSERLLSSGDRYADEESQRKFAAAYDEGHKLVPEGTDRMQLEVGANDWPLPIPIVEKDGRWRFDMAEGADEIIDRRIGRNELAAIRTLLAFVDAQKDFFERMKQTTGTGVYAQRLVSRPGRQDGLYWPAVEGEAESPLGPLVAAAQEEGYPGESVNGRQNPYQGYYFRMLKEQGRDADGGEMNYVRDGKMTGGFALIAWPASYGASGVTTFEVNQDGVVFQKDFGPETAKIVAGITRYNPDLSWARVEVAADQ